MVKLQQNLLFHLQFIYNPGQEYCIAVKSNTPEYIMWISDLGQEDLMETLVSEQPHIGQLFKGTIKWFTNPASTQDMKFTLRAAKFDTTAAGNLTLTNDVVPSQTLGKNPLL